MRAVQTRSGGPGWAKGPQAAGTRRWGTATLRGLGTNQKPPRKARLANTNHRPWVPTQTHRATLVLEGGPEREGGRKEGAGWGVWGAIPAEDPAEQRQLPCVQRCGVPSTRAGLSIRASLWVLLGRNAVCGKARAGPSGTWVVVVRAGCRRGVRASAPAAGSGAGHREAFPELGPSRGAAGRRPISWFRSTASVGSGTGAAEFHLQVSPGPRGRGHQTGRSPGTGVGAQESLLARRPPRALRPLTLRKSRRCPHRPLWASASRQWGHWSSSPGPMVWGSGASSFPTYNPKYAQAFSETGRTA